MRDEVMGTPVDLLDFKSTLERAELAMATRDKCVHVALNTAKLVKLQDDVALRDDVHGGDIIGIDGMGIVLALRWLKGLAAERVPGVDLMNALLQLSAKKGYRPFVLGAKQEVLEQATQVAQARWPGLEFAGHRNGYFSEAEEFAIVESINEAAADCLFLAMPTPKKERFMAKHRAALNVPFIMGVGGSIDVLSGAVGRAPIWMQNAGLEWLYRLYQEPRKMFMRYATTNSRFIWHMLREKLKR